jgi:DNA helicase-2/ATP-dependent DNA helicase PcrA
MLSLDALTPAQRSVARHPEGPAVVSAVPGAGKTTAVAHRIRVLVQDRGVPPDRILACSFNRSTVADLTEALHSLDVHGVDTRTVHSLGHALRTGSDHYAPPPADAPSPSAAAHRLARQALRRHARTTDCDVEALPLSAPDLVERVAAWKQRLVYADLDRAALPPDAVPPASEAAPDDDDLAALYAAFEALRHETGWVTYADMLRDGWAALVRDAALQARVQSAHDHVIVDEFQDVSRAPYEILDLLTASHRNYMAVGDEDQCIYRWRGARPHFLTAFADTYDAPTYQMTDSFRLPLPAAALANATMAGREHRPPKRIHVTDATAGTAEVLRGADAFDTARRMADAVVQTLDDGVSPADLAILVRTYDQTPPLEQALIERDCPYRVVGQSPFYRRRPVQTLLRYLYWAVLERRRRRRGWFDDDATARQYVDRFSYILNHPSRYVQQERVDLLTQEAVSERTSILALLDRHLDAMPAETRDRAAAFLETAAALVERLDDPAGTVVRALVAALDYEAVLRERSRHAPQANARRRTVQALARYADAFETVPALLRGVRERAAPPNPSDAAVEMRSIHRAKGAEWPVVLVPGCVEGTLPYAPSERTAAQLDEERRLFYVALTRTQDRLYLGTRSDAETARFLREATPETHLPLSRRVQSALGEAPDALTPEAVAHLCRGVDRFRLDRFLAEWWAPSPARIDALQTHLTHLTTAAADARAQRAAHREAQAEYEDARAALDDDVQTQVETLRRTLGEAPLRVDHEAPDRRYAPDTTFTFAWGADDAELVVHQGDDRVGILDPFGASRIDPETMFELPWASLVATFDGLAQGRRVLLVRLDWSATYDRLLAVERAALTSPPPLDDWTCLLTSEAFERGAEQLREALSKRTSAD